MKKIPGDIIILHKCTITDNHIYNVWFPGYGAQQTEFFVILDHFLPFYAPNNPKYKNFEITKKAPGDIIILNMCTTII